MVVYAAATDVSVGRMFLGGVLPGLTAGLMLMIAIYIAARWQNLPSQPFAGFREIFDSAKDASWGLFLIVIILGGIYGGIFYTDRSCRRRRRLCLLGGKFHLSRHGTAQRC